VTRTPPTRPLTRDSLRIPGHHPGGLGYEARATNDFADITRRFDAKDIDPVVFGGQVPPDRKAEIRDQIAAINSQVIFVQGLAGIPGLIVNQVRGSFAAARRDPTRAPTFTPTTGRSG